MDEFDKFMAEHIKHTIEIHQDVFNETPMVGVTCEDCGDEIWVEKLEDNSTPIDESWY